VWVCEGALRQNHAGSGDLECKHDSNKEKKTDRQKYTKPHATNNSGIIVPNHRFGTTIPGMRAAENYKRKKLKTNILYAKETSE
jgi:hypothetical protein